MKAYAYVRVSSDSQAKKDLSIPSQLKLIREYAQKHNIQIVKEYADEGESALSANRPNFLKMIADAKRNEKGIKAILVWKLSRFARNREDSILYKALLKKKGIQVISISEPIDDSPSGKLLEGMIEVIDEFYSNNLSQETLRGMIENARRGYRNGGFAPFGYRSKRVFDEKGNPKTKLEINPQEAEIVKTIFRLYLQGYGTKNIAKYLNEKGLKPRKVKYWITTRIGEILKNEVYIGWTVFNKRDKRNSKRLKPKSEWIIIKNTHPKIIDEETFFQVQKIMEKRNPKEIHPRIVASKYLLSGLLKCAKCGGNYTVSDYGRDKKYAYYNCSNYIKKGKEACRGRRIRADILDKQVLKKIKNKIFSDENIKELVKDVNDILNNLIGGNAKEITKIKKELAGVETRIRRYYEAIENGGIDYQLVAERLRELNEEKNKLKAKLDYYKELERKTKYLKIDESVLRDLRKELERIFVGENIYEKREFLKKFIEKIIVDDDYIKIFYYAPNPYGIGVYKDIEGSLKEDVHTMERKWLQT